MQVCGIFYFAISNFPFTAVLILQNFAILHRACFKSAVMKVQVGHNAGLSKEERSALSDFKVEAAPTDYEAVEKRLPFTEEALGCQSLEEIGDGSTFMHLTFLFLTTNVCEILFSKASYFLNHRFQVLSHLHFEPQLSLYLNSNLWGAWDVKRNSSY